MLAVATTTVDILRGTAVDPYSGAVAGEVTVAAGRPASITETGRTVADPSTGTPRLVRFVTGRLNGSEDVRRDDRLRDNRTSRLYQVVSVRQPQNPALVTDVTVELKRVDPVDP